MKTYLFNPSRCDYITYAFKAAIDKIGVFEICDGKEECQIAVISFEDIEYFSSFPERSFKNLRYIAIAGSASKDSSDKLSTQFKAKVFSAPSQAIVSVAERNLLLTLSVMQKLFCQILNKQQKDWNNAYGLELKGKIMGFWGFGKIAKYLTPIYRSLGMEIICVTSQDLSENDQIKQVSEDELLKKADVINMQLRLSEGNIKILSKEKINLLKQGSVFINTARADLVDCDALYKSLQKKHILGAGFDVFEEEPIPKDHPLWELDNVIMTPHSAFKTKETLERFFYHPLLNISKEIHAG